LKRLSMPSFIKVKCIQSIQSWSNNLLLISVEIKEWLCSPWRNLFRLTFTALLLVITKNLRTKTFTMYFFV
jgi:hypothetical protein